MKHLLEEFEAGLGFFERFYGRIKLHKKRNIFFLKFLWPPIYGSLSATLNLFLFSASSFKIMKTNFRVFQELLLGQYKRMNSYR